ncbi:hypothetical protein GCM10010170_100770 [Dactylosporangium salmoneum]|uniref:Transposase n=1 Tax=Dactylosporangium salmoneum TaxID=53361 RepID=A0ABN3HX70_9ACTN
MGRAAAEVGVGRVPFPPEVIVVAVRWYLRFNLSYRDVEELPVERDIEVDHVTVNATVPAQELVGSGSRYWGCSRTTHTPQHSNGVESL